MLKYGFLAFCLIANSIVFSTLKGIMPSKNQKSTLLVGFYGGVNFSKPLVLEFYQIIESIDDTPAINEKEYEGFFSNFGNQFGFVAFYPVVGNFHIGLLPSFSTYSYHYNSYNSWIDPSLPDASINQTFKHHQKLRYIECPLVARYYFGTNAFKPFLHGIFSYGFMHSTDKVVESEINYDLGTSAVPITSSENSASYTDSFIKSKLSMGGGAGVSYDLNQLILTLDVSYLVNLNNITNESNRYSNPNFTGASYDIQDDIRLNSIFINLGLIFPINKITKRGAVECTYFKSR